MRSIRYSLLTTLLLGMAATVALADRNTLRPMDIFELEWASDPQISPDGEWIAYVRNFMDIMTTRGAPTSG